jgi:hypothetical protein
MTDPKATNEVAVNMIQTIPGTFKPTRDYLGEIAYRAWLDYCDKTKSFIQEECHCHIGEAIWAECEKRNCEPLRGALAEAKHHLERMAQDNASLDKRNDNLAKECNEHLQKRREAERELEEFKGNIWHWVGDGKDDLESLVCPVLIPAEQLREMVASLSSSLAQAQQERDKLQAENKALAMWSCSSCGCRFSQLPPQPEITLEGVVRCSKCVEVEVMANLVASLRQQLAAKEEMGIEAEKLIKSVLFGQSELMDIMTGWGCPNTKEAKQAAEYFLSQGLLEKHPTKDWYKWTAASKQEGEKGDG